MSAHNLLPLVLGLIIFSFLLTSIAIVPFIDLLYKLKLTRRKEAPKVGKVPLFDKLHDIKAGTPVGGGILVVAIVSILFIALFPLATYLGVYVESAFSLNTELFIIFFTFVSFALLGLSDDLITLFGTPRAGKMGMWIGLGRSLKFLLQWVLAFTISFLIYKGLGVQIVHIPMIGKTISLGFWYVPLASFVIVSFTNAVNITDGLDGLVSGLLMICLIAFGGIAGSSLDTPLSIFIALWLGGSQATNFQNGSNPPRIFGRRMGGAENRHESLAGGDNPGHFRFVAGHELMGLGLGPTPKKRKSTYSAV